LVTTPPDVHPLSSPLRDAVGPATDPPATSGPPPDADGFTVISVYTRAQAIAKADPSHAPVITAISFLRRNQSIL
jgi:hypothetical protein